MPHDPLGAWAPGSHDPLGAWAPKSIIDPLKIGHLSSLQGFPYSFLGPSVQGPYFFNVMKLHQIKTWSQYNQTMNKIRGGEGLRLEGTRSPNDEFTTEQMIYKKKSDGYGRGGGETQEEELNLMPKSQ